MSRTRVLFLTTGLDRGGAELMLFRLIACLDTRFQASVVSLISPGKVGDKMTAQGIEVRSLGMRRGIPDPLSFARLICLMRREQPDVVQTWMYHADLIGGLAARAAGSIPVIWGIRHSDPSTEGYGRITMMTVRACAHLSQRLPARIVCCSDASLNAHARAGYDAGRMLIIPNGVDLSAFKPGMGMGRLIRERLNIPQHAALIGMIGRFHPQKDHAGFVRAAGRLAAKHSAAFFVLCGDGVVWENGDLAGRIDVAGLRDRFRLLGPRDDVAAVMSACDLVTSSSSYGESFANVISEAMSCGVPCVVTDVGDSAFIVGDTGMVVPPRDDVALASAWQDMLTEGPDRLRARGIAARRRIESEFDMSAVALRYENLYDRVAGRGARV